MSRAIQVAAVLSGVWSIVVGAGWFVVLSFWAAFSKGQLIGGSGWQTEHTLFAVLCGVIEFINLFALWAAFRQQRWSCYILTGWLVVFLAVYPFLSVSERVFADIPPFFLFPSVITGLLLFCNQRRPQQDV